MIPWLFNLILWQVLVIVQARATLTHKEFKTSTYYFVIALTGISLVFNVFLLLLALYKLA